MLKALRESAMALALLALCAAQADAADEDSERRAVNAGSKAYLVKVYAAMDPEKPLETGATGSGQMIRGTDSVPRILTNHHVVGDKATHVWIHFDGEPFAQKVAIIGRDPVVDIALLEAPQPLPVHTRPIAIMQRSVEVGERVYAIGFPSGVRTFTQGSVISESSPNDFAGMQIHFSTQAPVAPGSSGGVTICLNEKGEAELCGINTAVGVSEKQLISNFTYSIRAHGVISRVLPRLEREKRVAHAFMGLALEDTRLVNPLVYEAITKSPYPPARPGIIVSMVAPRSPAAAAGFLPGDVITGCEVKLDGEWVALPATSAAVISETVFFDMAPGTQMRFKTERGSQKPGRELTLTDLEEWKASVTPPKRPPGPSNDQPRR